MRKAGAKAATVAYAGYKWFEDHTDEVERWSGKAVERSRGKRIEKLVVPAAGAAQSAVRWMRDNNDRAKQKSGKPAKR